MSASLACLMLGVAGSALAQTTTMKPTAAVSTLPAAAPTASATDTTTQAPPEHKLSVDYSDGKISVDASNAGLNEVLREVGQKAKIKIVGSVADERVFGQYGPATPQVILATLLDGTGSNMLLVDDAKGDSQLILTQRHGAASPPNPNASRGGEEPTDGATTTYVPPVRPYQPPTVTGRGPARANADGSVSFAPPAPPDQNAADSTTNSDGSQKTPQQIYDQLQKAMQQKANAAQNPQ